MEQQNVEQPGNRGHRQYRPPGGRVGRDAGIDLFGDGGRIRDMERIYRILNQGGMPEDFRDDKFTLDEAFLFAEEHIHQTKEEPAYMKQAKTLEKQIATEDTLIESLLRLLIQMS